MTETVSAVGSRHLAAPVFTASLLAFAGTLTGGALYFRDIALLHRPTRLVVQGIWASGTLPLWDAGHDGGRALLANPNHRVLHPTALLDLVMGDNILRFDSGDLRSFPCDPKGESGSGETQDAPAD